MDSITHIALGATVGEIMLGKKIGKYAMIVGAAANSFPDIDIVASLWLTPADSVLAHRGFTHSFLFIILMTLIFFTVARQWDKQHLVSRRGWLLFFLIQLGIHLFVDAFNAYGVGWFIPFNDTRISFNTIFVVDPFYSSLLVVAFIVLLLFPLKNKYRIQIASLGLIISSLYLCYAITNKYLASNEAKAILNKKNINYHRFFTTPTPLNSWLWFVVAEIDSGYYLGYRSVFDKTDTMPLTLVPKNENLLNGWEQDHALHQLKIFSQGYYTVEYQSDTLVFNDLRFGQINGWYTPNAKFSFHYYLNYPKENLLVMQRGRFANWNEDTAKSLITRIQGIP